MTIFAHIPVEEPIPIYKKELEKTKYCDDISDCDNIKKEEKKNQSMNSDSGNIKKEEEMIEVKSIFDLFKIENFDYLYSDITKKKYDIKPADCVRLDRDAYILELTCSKTEPLHINSAFFVVCDDSYEIGYDIRYTRDDPCTDPPLEIKKIIYDILKKLDKKGKLTDEHINKYMRFDYDIEHIFEYWNDELFEMYTLLLSFPNDIVKRKAKKIYKS